MSIVWLRRDLRLADNPALAAAARRGCVVPLFIRDREWGGAQRWWLHHSLASLDQALRTLGSRLILRSDPAPEVVTAIAAETGADRVYSNREYTSDAIDRDDGIAADLERRGVGIESFGASLLAEPEHLLKHDGTPYAVFTAFWKALRARHAPRPPVSAPGRLEAPPSWPNGESLAQWNLLPTPDWAAGLRSNWKPGESSAHRRLTEFLEHGLAGYATRRDRPDVDGSSRLSPHLAFGEVSPLQVWHAVATAGDREPRNASGAESFLRELGWREFAQHLLFHHATLPERPLRKPFEAFPWRRDRAALAAWQRGRTGFPIVDAGMRQLWQTGWMHNRVRMIVASFLVKDLLLPWQEGAAWFTDTLVDADMASNSANWQWVAGCGVDAAPYFRVFNPVLQGRKFDPDGTYVRRFVPELEGLPKAHIHEPWRAPPEVLGRAGIARDRGYPAPIVDHGAARERALAAWRSLPRDAA